jgi:alpha-galactosidase
MQIVRHMEHQCPQALLINFTNPLMRICDAITRYSTIRVVGLCHQIRMGYAMVGKALAGDYHWQVSPKFNSTRATPSLTEIKAQLAHQAMQQFDIYAAGLNHFTWMLGLHDKQSGEDLYPLFFRRWNDLEPSFEPLTRQVYETFDLFPIPGDEHLCEYLPWMDDAQNEPWNKFDLSLYEWDLWAKEREKNEQAIRDYIDGEKDIETLRAVHSEGAVEIIEDLGGTQSQLYPQPPTRRHRRTARRHRR